eukprot:544400-Prorocentrum_minimum.AAC.1
MPKTLYREVMAEPFGLRARGNIRRYDPNLPLLAPKLPKSPPPPGGVGDQGPHLQVLQHFDPLHFAAAACALHGADAQHPCRVGPDAVIKPLLSRSTTGEFSSPQVVG